MVTGDRVAPGARMMRVELGQILGRTHDVLRRVVGVLDPEFFLDRRGQLPQTGIDTTRNGVAFRSRVAARCKRYR